MYAVVFDIDTNCLNDNFYEIFTKVAPVTPLPDFPMRTEKECKPRDDFLSEIYVLDELNKLDRTKSIGTDGPACVERICFLFCISTLMHIQTFIQNRGATKELERS
jgi:hypothetical protein